MALIPSGKDIAEGIADRLQIPKENVQEWIEETLAAALKKAIIGLKITNDTEITEK